MYASGQTPHLKLPQWREGDFVRMEDFNGAMETLDGYVDTVNGQIDDLGHDLTAKLQRTNYNVYQLLAREWFAATWEGADPEALYFNNLQSAEEAGTCTGFSWKEHPIHLGLYSAGRDSDGNLQPELDILDASIRKTIALDGPFSQVTLLVQAQGWYSRTPPLTGLPYHTEDYTGIAISASVNNQAMSLTATRASSYPAETPVSLREWQFQLDTAVDGSTTVEIHFDLPADLALWVYGWALVLA